MVYIVTSLFIVMDMVTGLLKAFKEKNYTSSIMREGLFHKCGSLICVAFGVLVDYAQSIMDLGVQIPISTTICVYICLMEIGSVIENICVINPDILPEKLTSYFQKLSKK